MHPLRHIIALAITASLLASGCCCPLSGRYNEVGCCPPCMQRCCPAPCPAPYPLMENTVCPPADPACPPGNAASNAVAEDCPPECDACEGPFRRLFWPHNCGLSRWLTLGFGQGNVPSQQHPAYHSPPAKFHPIPTRPAFEPLPSYPPLMPADSGMNNPLRASASPPTAPLSR
jgi:hypothetical protein